MLGPFLTCKILFYGMEQLLKLSAELITDKALNIICDNMVEISEQMLNQKNPIEMTKNNFIKNNNNNSFMQQNYKHASNHSNSNNNENNMQNIKYANNDSNDIITNNPEKRENSLSETNPHSVDTILNSTKLLNRLRAAAKGFSIIFLLFFCFLVFFFLGPKKTEKISNVKKNIKFWDTP